MGIHVDDSNAKSMYMKRVNDITDEAKPTYFSTPIEGNLAFKSIFHFVFPQNIYVLRHPRTE